MAWSAWVPGSAAVAATTNVGNAKLDAALFYEVLVGELQLRAGAPAAALELMLDAARKTKDAGLFRRAADIAHRANYSEQALTVALAWVAAHPDSLAARGYQTRALLMLGRLSELIEPLRTMVYLTPSANRAPLIASLPRLLAHASDQQAAAMTLETTLEPFLDQHATAVVTRVSLGRTWLAAQDRTRTLDLAQQAHARDPRAEGPALLALELFPGTPSAEPIVVSYLTAKPTGNAIRMIYARALTVAHRYVEAISQFEAVTNQDPDAGASWLSLGALYLELKQAKQAAAALQKYVQQMRVQASTTTTASSSELDEGKETLITSVGLPQAYLMLAQAAEQERDFAAAEAWLAKVDNPQRAFDIQVRRASILAGQGKLTEALALLHSTEDKDNARARLMAETQILRELKLWPEANARLTAANRQFPDDADLLYEQSIVAEKLGRPDEMERLLRRVIAINDKHHHAYNALGYSLAERNQRLPEARTLIRKALELMPGEPFITDSLGWVEYRLGNREEATRLLRLAYRSRPDVEIAVHLGEVLWVCGQRDEARRILRDARSRDANNDVLRETVVRLQVDL